jgi:hypothetical protein
MTSPTPAGPQPLHVALTTFMQYLSAQSSGRLKVVHDALAIYGQTYGPGPAFYQEITRAFVDGQLRGDDELRVRRVVAKQNDPARAKAYRELETGWLSWIKKPIGEPVRIGRAAWTPPGLEVSINPELGYRAADGRVTVVKLYFKSEPLGQEAVRGAHRLMARFMDEIAPGGVPAVLDVRRAQLHRINRRPYKRNYDAYLESEATGLADLWRRVARTA